MRMVVDCAYLCYKSLYTMEGLSHNEKMVGVIFGFIRQILKLSRQFETGNFVFCWDSRQSYRKLIDPEYKANRRKDLTDEQQEDLSIAYGQFDELREKVLPYMGFSNIFHQTGYEADDLIAHIVYRFPDDTIIVSADNDLFQLIRHDRFCPVRMWNFKTINDEARFTTDWFGLKPSDWVMVKTIAGCSGDNVIGVTGVGDVTAAKYVAGVLKGKKVELIENWQKEDKAKMDRNHALVSLPFYSGKKPIKIDGIQEDFITQEKFQVTFGQYGFRSLLAVDEMAKWTKSFFGGLDNGGVFGPNAIRKIQR